MNGGARFAYKDILLIFAVWLIFIGTMRVLQWMGLDYGFDIRPFGEFRNWMDLLNEGTGWKPAKLFWSLDYRNALSPWWYLAARPLIEAIPAAPLILQLLAGLFVGVCGYLLLAELTFSRAFGLSVGLLSSLFIVNAYRDGVIWNFVGALGCSLLSIWLFALFCQDRRKSGYLGASLVVWFIAFGTYTIQTGAMGAIYFVSLRDRLTVCSWPRAMWKAALDVLPYAALLALYLLIWITTTADQVPSAFTFKFSPAALSKSLAFGIWNEYYQFFWIWLVRGPPMAVLFVLLAALILVLGWLVQGRDCVRPTIQSLCFALLIGACVAAPTVILEAMSDVWLPGTRWPMLLQFWSPFLFCVLSFALMSALPVRFWRPTWLTFNACAAAFVILLDLGFNRTQVLHVRQERVFFDQLGSAVAQDRASGKNFPRRYLIQLVEPAHFLPFGRLRDVYARTLLGRDVTFEVVATFPKSSGNETFLLWKDQHLAKPIDLVPSGPAL